MNYAWKRAGRGSSFLAAISPLKCNFTGRGIRVANELFATGLANDIASSVSFGWRSILRARSKGPRRDKRLGEVTGWGEEETVSRSRNEFNARKWPD